MQMSTDAVEKWPTSSGNPPVNTVTRTVGYSFRTFHYNSNKNTQQARWRKETETTSN